MRLFIAPILLKKAASVEFPLTIDKGVLIRDFSVEEREEFFGIKDLKIKGTQASWKPLPGRDILREAFSVGMDYMSLLRAESCIEIRGSDKKSPHILQEKMEFMNRALKVLKSGSAGFLIGKFSGKKTDNFFPGGTLFAGINPLYGKNYILNKNDVPELKNIYRILTKRTGEKTTMLLERFILAISKNLRKHMKVLEFFSILETLYLPGTEHGELRFRLAQRIAKMMCSKGKRYEEYREIKKLYDKRSILIHQSKDKFTDDELARLEDLTRVSLRLFLKKPESFEVDHLEKLLLD